MLNAAGAFLISAAIAAAATPMFRVLALKFEFIDPVGDPRKIHTGRIPRIGGLAIALAMFVALLFISRDEPFPRGPMFSALWWAAGGMVLLGLYDDLHGAHAYLKLVVQTIAAVALVRAGFRIERVSFPFGVSLALGATAAPITVLWIVGVTNAVNLVDGLDGLASGIVVAALAALAAIFWHLGRPELVLAAALSGATIGFLIYNAPPASIFMGDTGSLLLGLMLAVLTVLAASPTRMSSGGNTISVLIPVAILVVPLSDTTLVFGSRVWLGRSPFKGDRNHIHHRLLAFGLSDRAITLALVAITVVGAIAALALELGTWPATMIGLALLAVASGGLAAIPVLHRRRCVQPTLPQSFGAAAAQARVALQSATDEHALWEALVAFVDSVGASSCKLSIVPLPGIQEHTAFRWKRDDTVDEQGAMWSFATGQHGSTFAVGWTDPAVREGESAALQALTDDLDLIVRQLDEKRTKAGQSHRRRIRSVSGSARSPVE
jgi:UDP-GlcNAc:undecaprenyl-phosphate GlcNAc-1-phosphate transferase